MSGNASRVSARQQALLPRDYFDARDRFRAAAAECGAGQKSHPIRATADNGETLTIDAALLGDPRCERVLVVSSGLHGVEGFIGSAVQTRMLQKWAVKPLAEDIRVVFLHALNPYGFAQLRRVNEDNVDLNRNFLDEFNGGSAADSRYEIVNKLLNPCQPPSRLNDAGFFLAAYRMIRQHGRATLKQIVAEGQYEFPAGLFYGGHEMCETTKISQGWLRDWTGDGAQVLHLDLHSGLGPPGTITLLLHGKHSEETLQALRQRFSGTRIQRHDASGGAYKATGTLGLWCEGSLDKRSYVFSCAEFGTHGSLHVLRALRAENQAHHWATPGSATWRRAKRNLVGCFCPSSRRWQEQMVVAGTCLIERAVGWRKI